MKQLLLLTGIFLCSFISAQDIQKQFINQSSDSHYFSVSTDRTEFMTEKINKVYIDSIYICLIKADKTGIIFTRISNERQNIWKLPIGKRIKGIYEAKYAEDIIAFFELPKALAYELAPLLVLEMEEIPKSKTNKRKITKM